ncbi:hypothetical protein BOTCAL_0198g00100 [Botryotinia calthae]|uniref:Uncharacterized protein n=1 Tax=Botryotinia calthae TaxID=38488 RepID=A0A4Y8CZF9_9HELO|nr:hypothetical protein BOTCAL_0198g00100 [Botryotinia calthae]
MNGQSLANMTSIDGDTSVTEALGHDQNPNSIEKRKCSRRSSVATPAKSSIFSNVKATPKPKDRLFASIEVDDSYDSVTPSKSSAKVRGNDSYDPVTPSKSSAKAVRSTGRKKVRSLSPRKVASTKCTPKKISRITESSKKREITKHLEKLSSTLLREGLEDDDDDWEAENDGVKSDDNNWGQVDKVIGSAGKPTHPNGRVEGRQLVPWHRPRMMEKLILNMVYEFRRSEITLPWDKVAHRQRPGSSGAAAMQHINKLREILITEGHLVPPPFGKKNAFDPNIRGYIRDMNSEDPKATRPVTWDEEIEDLKESLVIPGVTRGSGTYRRNRAQWQNNKATIVEETPTKTLSTQARPDKRASKAKTDQKEKSFMIKKERSESIDPAEMPSDEDYDPGNRLKIKGHRKRKVKVKTERKYDLDETSDSEGELFGYSDDDEFLAETPSKKIAGNYAMAPLAGLPLKLKISPDKLKKFAADLSMNSAEEEVAVNETEYNVDYGNGDDDAETIVGAHARDVDDVFGQGGLHLNNGNVGLQNQLFFNPYGYNGGIIPGSGIYNPQGALNAQAYNPVYGQTSYNNHNFMNSETGPYENTLGNYHYFNNTNSNHQTFGFQNSNLAPVMNHGLNFDGSGETMQDVNGGINSMSSLPLSFGDNSSDASAFNSFADSVGTDYDGAPVTFIDPSEVSGQFFESPDNSLFQDYDSNQPFNSGDNNL